MPSYHLTPTEDSSAVHSAAVREVPSFIFDEGKGRKAAAGSTREALQVVTRALRDRGIDNPTELLRAMTVVAAERCIAAFDDDPDTGPGWLAAALRAGGTWESVRNHTRRPPSPSELLRKLDEADQNGTAA